MYRVLPTGLDPFKRGCGHERRVQRIAKGRAAGERQHTTSWPRDVKIFFGISSGVNPVILMMLRDKDDQCSEFMRQQRPSL